MKRKIAVIAFLALLALGALYWWLKSRPQPEARSFFLFDKTASHEVRDDFRQSVVLNGASPVVREFRVPAEGRLTFSYGIARGAWEKAGGVFTFRVQLTSPEESTLFSRELHPAEKKDDRLWNDCLVDLSHFSGRKVRLSFELSGPGAATAFVSQGKISSFQNETQRWNVVLITIDTLRRDHLSIYGYDRQTSPEMDVFGKRSIVYTNAFSTAPLTLPSVTSIMTSTFFSQHLVLNNRSFFGANFLTLAQLLHRSGYTTAAFVCNAVLRPNRKLDAGFDVYNAFLPSVEVNRRLPERNAAHLNTAALPWLKSHSGERFFLWLHYQDPHAPYTPPEEVSRIFDPAAPGGKTLGPAQDETGLGGIPDYARIPGVSDPDVYTARYDAEIHFVDSKVGQVLKTLQDLKIADRTVVVISSDHGESLGEDNHYYAHGHNLTAELTNVPLMLSIPGRRAEKIDRVVSTIDIAPTIMKLVNTKAPASFQGRSLLEVDSDRAVISEQPGIRWALIGKNGRTIYERTGRYESGSDSAAEHKILQQWIGSHLSNGCVFAFSGQRFSDIKISSGEHFKRAFLFDGEARDGIAIEPDAITVNVDATSGDADYLFVEPAAGSPLQVDGQIEMRDSHGQAIPQRFVCDSMAETSASTLPQPPDFHFTGAIVIRKGGVSTSIRLSPEEAEELKSLGYVNQ